jgi:hypothetical protein
MAMIRREVCLCFVAFFCMWASSNGLLSPKGVNFEGINSKTFFSPIATMVFFTCSYLVGNFHLGVLFAVQALMGIKASLMDPHGVLENWDGDSVDPCSWTMVTCSPESLVIGL